MQIPDHIKIDLNRCKTCTLYTPGFKTFVPPDGPLTAQLIKCGEAPGQTEVKKGIPFCGKAGIEDTRYSKDVGIYRYNTYVTNVCKCHPPENSDPTEHEIECCSYILKQELEAVKTQYIACLGRIASKWFLGQAVDMESIHGIPFYCEFLPDSTHIGHRIVIPMYHPAYGLHDPRNMIFVESDYKALGNVIYKNEIPRELGYDAGKYNQYEQITTEKQLINLFTSNITHISIDTESENDDPWCLTFAVEPKHSYMILRKDIKLLSIFKDLIQKLIVIFHHAKHDIPILSEMNIYIKEFEDTMVMAYLLQDLPRGLKSLAYRISHIKMEDYSDIIAPAQEGKSLAYLCEVLQHTWPNPDPIQQILPTGKQHTKHPQNIAKKAQRIINDYQKNPQLDLWERWHNIGLDEGRKMVQDKLGPMPAATLADIPFVDALKYACRDASATLSIYPYLKSRIIDSGLEETYKRDLGIIRWLIAAEQHGMLIDVDYLKELTKYFDMTMDELRINIECMYAGELNQDHKYINPSSTQQIAKLLYDLGLTHSRTASTDSHALDKIRTKHPIVNLITDYRELKKLKGTYSKKLPLYADENNIIKSRINTIKTATGRLSVQEPPLQTIPMRTETGRKIKRAFVAPPGCVMLSSDYSQIEMRLTAHDSQDKTMIDIFNSEQDIHTKTASWIFNKPEQEIDPQLERYPCKRVGFGVIYGISGAGLSDILRAEGLDFSERYCDDLIKAWFKIYPGVKRLMEMCQYNAIKDGLVRDFCGRYRLIPGAKSALSYIKNEALRQAVNVPAQSGAGQIIKEAMRLLYEINDDLTQGGKYIVQPVMQIHDDLLYYVSEDIVEETALIIKSVMENAIKLSVPVRVDQKYGYNWLEMKED